MDKWEAVRRVDSLSLGELRHFVQIWDNEISMYRFVIRNYNEEKMRKFGSPHLAKLVGARDLLVSRLSSEVE